jgi:hypothetical protein
MEAVHLCAKNAANSTAIHQKQKAPENPALSQSDMRLPEGRRKIDYLPEAIWPASEVNCVVIAVTMKGMMVTKQRPMAAAIKPYSIAVAPDSSFRNFFI